MTNLFKPTNRPAVEHFGSLSNTALSPRSLDLARPRAQPEFSTLFHVVRAFNTEHRSFVLQFVGSVAGEGTTTVASNFMRVASAAPDTSALLVECHPRRLRSQLLPRSVPSLVNTFRTKGSFEGAIRPCPGLHGIGLARLSNSDQPSLDVNGAELERLLDLLKLAFPIVVLDCPAVTESPDALAIARHCDGTVLVVRAETTPRRLVAATKIAVERFGGQVIGVVLNRRRSYVPRWCLRWL